MSPWPHLLLIFGVLALTLALRTYRAPILQKLGTLGVIATSYLAGEYLTGSRVIGAMCGASWLLLPWLDLLTRIRTLKVPVERNLRHKSPPGPHSFPTLGELTEEIEEEKFEHVDDAGWDWDEHQQFFRLFYKEDERMQAAICLADQEDMAFYYLSISSRGRDGTLWTTWNYPFAYSLKLAPEWRVNRMRGDYSFLQLLEGHRAMLKRNGITTELLAEVETSRIPEEIQKDLQTQVAHNLAAGVLTRHGPDEVRYSWRGLFFLWFQFLRDLVRLT